MVALVGLDLAWTGHRESGLCVLEGDVDGVRVTALETLVATPEAFAARVVGAGTDVVAAIDAPLIVTGERAAEAALARAFGRYGAYAYSANLPFLERMGGLAGPHLGALLAGAGVSLDPQTIERKATGRFAFEMYPHAMHIVLFGLGRILRYKRGTIAQRRAVLDVYRCCLAQLVEALPVMPSPRLDELLWAPLERLPGRDLKRVEDQLDALTCAIAAFEAWRQGMAAKEVFGSADHGYIAVPGLAQDERFA